MPDKKTDNTLQTIAERKSLTRAELSEQMDRADPSEQMEQNSLAGAEQKRLTRGRGGTGNFPNAQHDDKPADVRRVLTEVLNWYEMPRATSDEEIADRIKLFFRQCASNGERPTVEKFCLALGYARTTVNEWKNCMHCSAFRSDIIKRAFEVLAAYDAGMATEGKMNPVPYIFRAKNYYGMKDQTDLVVTPNNPLGETISVDAIEEKYMQLPED